MMLGDIQSEILELLPLVTGVCHKYFEYSGDAGKDLRLRKRTRQRMRWLDSIMDSKALNPRKHWEIVEDREASRAAVHEVAKNQT